MVNDDLEIFQEPIARGIKLIINGRISSANAQELEDRLEEALTAGYSHIILNMLLVDHLSSAGIKAILKAYKEARTAGGKLEIEGPSESVRNVLGMTALDTMLVK